MSKNVSHNALKSPTQGALTKNAPYRSAVKAPNLLEMGNKDPNRVYRWLSKSLLDKAGGLDRRGWEVLNEKNSKGETMVTQWGIHSSGTDLRVGDLVGAFMPVERNEMKKAAIAEANNSLNQRFESLRQQTVQAGGKFNGGFSSQRDGVTENFGTPLAE